MGFDKEKQKNILIDLIAEAREKCENLDCGYTCPYIKSNDCIERLTADHLLANGVTVNE